MTADRNSDKTCIYLLFLLLQSRNYVDEGGGGVKTPILQKSQLLKFYWLSLGYIKIISFNFWFLLAIFIRPSSDGTYYGMVMSVRPSGSPSVRPSQFSALFSYMLWDIELKFCVSLYFDARKSKFECHQFPSIFAGVMPLFNFKLSQICSFPHFFPTCFEILSWNFAYDFVIL